tara:strand:+ start:6375 stop:8450 length:2076 start_codon:yes stop_codon:yes gene_type:complete
MTTPEIRFAGNAVNDLGHPIAGLNGWNPVANVVAEDGNTADVTLVSTVDFKDTSRILLSQDHHFNIPSLATDIDQVEMNWKVSLQTDTTRFFMALYVGGYGTVTVLNSAGSGSDFFITVVGTPAELGHAGLSVASVNSASFGAAIVAHDPQKKSPTIKIDSVKIKVTFSSTVPIAYNESDDFFFAVGSHVRVDGKAKATPYFINLPGERDGGIITNGSHFVGGSQSMEGTGGALILPNAEVNPYFIDGTGGAVLGGIGYQTYNEVGIGGAVAGGLSPNGTHDFGLGGAVVGGLGDTKFDFVTAEGGMLVGGVGKATPYFINLPGETDGGVLVNSRAKTQYDEIATGGVLVNPGHYFSYPPLFGEGGSLIGGQARVTPFFETAVGGSIVAGSGKSEIGPPFGLEGGMLAGGLVSTTVVQNEPQLPGAGAVGGGHSAEFHVDIVVSGGSVMGGAAQVEIEPLIGLGGILAGGLSSNVSVKIEIGEGGVVLSGTFTVHHFLDGVGGLIVNGQIDHPIFKLSYSTAGGVTVEDATSVADVLFSLFYTGDGTVIIGGLAPLSAKYIPIPRGGVAINGQSVNKATYEYNVIVGTGLVIGSVSNTGIPHIFRAIRKPNGTVGRSLVSDNMFKSDMESLLITTIPPNPDLCGLSTEDIATNKCQGAFVPPQLVNRQRGHLPSPKQEEKNRGSQLAKSGQ